MSPADQLAYVVRFPPLSTSCGNSWILPEEAATDAKAGDDPPSGSALASGSSLSLLVQGKTDQTVVLQSLRAKVVGTSAPLRGAYVPSADCGGSVFRSYLKLDLDAPTPRAMGSAKATGPGVGDFPINVSQSEPVQLAVELDVAERRAEFVLLLDWSIGGRAGVLTLDDGGKPFTATSIQQKTSTRCAAIGGSLAADAC